MLSGKKFIIKVKFVWGQLLWLAKYRQLNSSCLLALWFSVCHWVAWWVVYPGKHLWKAAISVSQIGHLTLLTVVLFRQSSQYSKSPHGSAKKLACNKQKVQGQDTQRTEQYMNLFTSSSVSIGNLDCPNHSPSNFFSLELTKMKRGHTLDVSTVRIYISGIKKSEKAEEWARSRVPIDELSKQNYFTCRSNKVTRQSITKWRLLSV